MVLLKILVYDVLSVCSEYRSAQKVLLTRLTDTSYLMEYVPVTTWQHPAYIFQQAFGGNIGPMGEVWTTYSDIGLSRFGIIFASELNQPYSIGPEQARFGSQVYTFCIRSIYFHSVQYNCLGKHSHLLMVMLALTAGQSPVRNLKCLKYCVRTIYEANHSPRYTYFCRAEVPRFWKEWDMMLTSLN